MGTKQKCEWVCDLCNKKDYSYSDDHSPNDWCRARLELLFNGGQFGQGVMSRNKPSTWGYIDVCDDCFIVPYNKSRTSYDQADAKDGLIKRLMGHFGLTSQS